MKKVLFSLFAIVICLTFALPSNADVQCQKDNGFIAVSSSKTVELPPDTAQFVVSVETNAKTLELATSQNKTATNSVINALKANLKLNAGDSVKTVGYSVYPVYSKDSNRKIESYNVQNSVSVKTKDVASVGKLVDIAIKSGANKLSSLNFSVEDEDKYCNELYPQLVQDAYAQASTIAKAMKVSIVGVKSVNASYNTEYSNRMNFGMAMMKAGAMETASDTPIEPGKVKMNASLNVEYNVK